MTPTRKSRRSRATSTAATSAGRSRAIGCSSSAATRGCGRTCRTQRHRVPSRATRPAPTSRRRSVRTSRSIRCPTARRPGHRASTRTAHRADPEDYFVGKIDHTFSNADSFSMRYSCDDASHRRRPHCALCSGYQLRKAAVPDRRAQVDLHAALLNVVHVAWNRAYEATINVDQSRRSSGTVLHSEHAIRRHRRHRTRRPRPRHETPSFFDFKSLQIYENLTWSRGAHTSRPASTSPAGSTTRTRRSVRRQLRLQSLDDFVRAGQHLRGQAPGSTTDRKWRQNLFGLFVQDDCHVRTECTVNLGVRYEFITVPTENDDRVAHI